MLFSSGLTYIRLLLSACAVLGVTSLRDFGGSLCRLFRRLKPPVNRMSSLRDFSAKKPIRQLSGDTTLLPRVAKHNYCRANDKSDEVATSSERSSIRRMVSEYSERSLHPCMKVSEHSERSLQPCMNVSEHSERLLINYVQVSLCMSYGQSNSSVVIALLKFFP